jgi:hypothetical protein
MCSESILECGLFRCVPFNMYKVLSVFVEYEVFKHVIDTIISVVFLFLC